MKKTLLIAAALTTSAYTFSSGATPEAASPVLQSLPAEVQKEIEDVRAGCRGYLDAMGIDASQTWFSPSAGEVQSVSSGDEGLEVFTVSGAQAVMVNVLELCGGQCIRAINCTNRGSYNVAIYVRSGSAWRKALSTEATGRVFLSTTDYTVNTDGTVIFDGGKKFKALVLNVLGGNKGCPTRDIPLGKEGKERLFFPLGSSHALPSWSGTGPSLFISRSRLSLRVLLRCRKKASPPQTRLKCRRTSWATGA